MNAGKRISKCLFIGQNRSRDSSSQSVVHYNTCKIYNICLVRSCCIISADIVYFWFKYDIASTTHPKFNLIRVQTHDLQIMNSTLHVPEMQSSKQLGRRGPYIVYPFIVVWPNVLSGTSDSVKLSKVCMHNFSSPG